MSTQLIVERDPAGFATVTLNRPEARNALSGTLLKELHEAFATLAADSSIGVMILTGKGQSFCAGLDLKEMAKDRAAFLEQAARHNILDLLTSFAKPIIGAINGAAVTGGFELALACDVILAASDAFFADTHARHKLLPGWGLSQKLSRQIGITRAKEISLTGAPVSAALAERWGLVNRCVGPAELLPAAREMAKEMLRAPHDMLRRHKALIDTGYRMDMQSALEFEKRTLAEFS